MKQKYTKPEISSVEFKMEQGYAASQGMQSMGSLLNLSWDDIEIGRDESGTVHDHSFFGDRKTTHYFGGSTDNWD